MKLTYTAITSRVGTPDRVCLKIFTTTSLVQESFVETLVLEQFFKYGLFNRNLTIQFWDTDKKYQTLDKQFTLKELLQDCAEIQEYARQYFPEHAI